MSSLSTKTNEERIDFIQIISLALSIYILGALVVETILKLNAETVALLDKIDFIICFFFLYDFGIRFHRAKSKLEFLKWGWFDLVSSIPVYGNLQWARAARVVRILRAFRSTKILVQFLFEDQRLGTLGSAVLIAILMMIFSSIAVLNFETAPDSNIKTAEDALWWAFTTVATVGYGDKYPVTTEGRIVAVLLITSGVGLFGVYTAFVASFFVRERKREDNLEIKLLIEEVRLLRLQIDQIGAFKNKAEREESVIKEPTPPTARRL